MNSFTFINDWPGNIVLDANEVPIYDVFACKQNTHVCVIGPHYSIKVLRDAPVLEFDGFGEVVGKRVECPWHFTAVYLFPIPIAARSRGSLVVALTTKRGARQTMTISLPSHNRLGKLAAVTRPNFSTPHLPEWLDYHRQIGIEHFYIYGKPEVDPAPDITVVPWSTAHGRYPVGEWQPWWPNDSHLYVQPALATHACYKYGDRWDWLAVFDADEFFVPNSAATLPEVLDSVPSEDSAGWMVSGKWFGNSRRRVIPQTPVLEYYLKCEQGYTSAKKCIVRPELIRTFEVHQCSADAPVLDMPTKHLHFNHYRALSPLQKRRGPRYDNEWTNEATDWRILMIRDGTHHVETHLDPQLCHDLRRRFKLKYFVETGTLWGNTTRRAAKLFEKVWTIELFDLQFDRMEQALLALGNVQPIRGDSPKALPDIMPQLDKPTLFWLDAHYSGGGTAKGETECPLLDELRAIGGIGRNVILIDDARMFFEVPDPNTHDANEWPRFEDIKKVVGKWKPAPYVQVVGDVIVITPEK